MWDLELNLNAEKKAEILRTIKDENDYNKEMEHPLALVDGVSLTENRELIEMDVRRLGKDNIGYVDEKKICKVLEMWVKMKGKRYKQGMHEICGCLYLESGRDEEKTMEWFSSVMGWLYEMFYEDESVNRWVLNVFEPMLSGIDEELNEMLKRNGVEGTVWCVRWCRLLLLRELRAFEWREVWSELFKERDECERERFFGGIVVVMLLNIGPELLLSVDQSELLQLLLNYPGLRISVKELVNFARKVVDKIFKGETWNNEEYKNLGTVILSRCNPEWYQENKGVDINRLRMQSRLKKRVAWMLRARK